MKDKAQANAKDRKARLAEQLRANLQKRKAQARARRGGEADAREGLPTADERRKNRHSGHPADVDE